MIRHARVTRDGKLDIPYNPAKMGRWIYFEAGILIFASESCMSWTHNLAPLGVSLP